MQYLPLMWLTVAAFAAIQRPGLLVGCALLSYHFETHFQSPAFGAVLAAAPVALMCVAALTTQKVPTLRGTDFGVLVFWPAYALCAFYAPDTGAAINSTIRMFAFGLCMYLVARFFVGSPRYGDRFLFDVTVSTAISVLMLGAIAVAGAGPEAAGRVRLGESTAVGFAQAIDVSAALTLFYFLAADEYQPRRWRWIAIAAFGAIILIGLLNATRGTILSIMAAAALYLAIMSFIGRCGRWRRLAAVTFFSASITAFSLLFVDLGKYDLILASIARLTTNLGEGGLVLDASSSERLILLARAKEQFLAHPLTGVGVNGFAQNSYPHNMIAELLAETGLFVTALFAVILSRFAHMSLKLLRRSHVMSEAAMAVGLFMVAVAHHQVSFTLWMGKPLFFAMGAIAALYFQRTSVRVRAIRHFTQPSSPDYS